MSDAPHRSALDVRPFVEKAQAVQHELMEQAASLGRRVYTEAVPGICTLTVDGHGALVRFVWDAAFKHAYFSDNVRKAQEIEDAIVKAVTTARDKADADFSQDVTKAATKLKAPLFG